MKVKITEVELWPVFIIDDNMEKFGSKTIEIPEELYDEYKSVEKQNSLMQVKLKKFYKNKPRTGYKPGDRINHEYLGNGTLIENLGVTISGKKPTGWLIRFDNTPPEEYNCGENPCLVFESSISMRKLSDG